MIASVCQLVTSLMKFKLSVPRALISAQIKVLIPCQTQVNTSTREYSKFHSTDSWNSHLITFKLSCQETGRQIMGLLDSKGKLSLLPERPTFTTTQWKRKDLEVRWFTGVAFGPSLTGENCEYISAQWRNQTPRTLNLISRSLQQASKPDERR